MKKNTLRSVKKPRVGPGDNRDLVKRVGIYFESTKILPFRPRLTIFSGPRKRDRPDTQASNPGAGAYQPRGRTPFSPLGHPPTSVSMKKNTLRSVKKPRVGPGDNRDLVKRVGIYFESTKILPFRPRLTIFPVLGKGIDPTPKQATWAPGPPGGVT